MTQFAVWELLSPLPESTFFQNGINPSGTRQFNVTKTSFYNSLSDFNTATANTTINTHACTIKVYLWFFNKNEYFFMTLP